MLYIIFIFIWPLVNYLNLNFNKITDFNEIFIFLIVICFLIFSTFILIKFFLKGSVDRAILPLLGSMMLFFNYGSIVDNLGTYNVFFLKSSLIYALIFLGTGLFLWKICLSEGVQKISKVIVCCVILIPFVSLGKKYVEILKCKQVTYSIFSKKSSFRFVNTPNIYYLLIDAYARQDLLSEVFGYNNEFFLKDLEKIGFIVSRKARSNYHFTIASLSASMNMEYHKPSEGNFSCAQMQTSLKGRNKVRETVRQNGYNITNIPSHWKEIGCFGNEDVCVRGNNYEVYESFLSSTPLRVFGFPNDYVSFNTLKNSIYSQFKKPNFIFAHFAQIHDAIFNEYGEICPALHPCFSGKRDGKRYISSIKIMNTKIMEFVVELRKKDPDSIIIIQADHGPTYTGNLSPNDPTYWLKEYDSMRLNNKQDFRYTFGIFTAIYLPNYDDRRFAEAKKYFSGEFTLVNTFRYVFAYLSDMVPNLLPEKSHFLYYDQASQAYKEDNIDHITN